MTPEESAARWPLHAKLKSYDGPKLSILAAFLDWLWEAKGLHVGKFEFEDGKGDLIPAYENEMDLALEYVCVQLGIDRGKFHDESRDMYTYLHDHTYFNQ